MLIILKILLSILCFTSGFCIYFFGKDWFRLTKNIEFDESSLKDKIIIFLMAFLSIFGLSAICILSAILLFSKIAITLPWLLN